MKARVIITLDCNRKCDGCCNTDEMIYQAERIRTIRQVSLYDEIMLTGGEPMLHEPRLLSIINSLRSQTDWAYTGNLYIYTALYTHEIRHIYREILPLIDGLQFTLHAEANDKDVAALQQLSKLINEYRRANTSMRLCIDHRLYGRYDFGNINLAAWDSVRRMRWIPDCPLPEGEKLFILEE